MQRKLGAIDVKQAVLSDQRFRDLFPELKDDINAILRNPGCACNRAHLEKFFQYQDRLAQYFPTRLVETIPEQIAKAKHWSCTVINCRIDELEGLLKKLPNTRKQVAVTRYQDQVTVILNELDEVW